MKKFLIMALVAMFAFNAAACGSDPTPKAKASAPQAAQQEDMTQFSSDFGNYMETVVAKEMDISTGVPNIEAKCKPDQGKYGTRCWVVIGTTLGDTTEKATAENVRRVGDKFVWDHES